MDSQFLTVDRVGLGDKFETLPIDEDNQSHSDNLLQPTEALEKNNNQTSTDVENIAPTPIAKLKRTQNRSSKMQRKVGSDKEFNLCC
jgi:hypothetical protein